MNNTGNDFIYPDNFADPLDTYLKLTGQKDGNGNLLTSNPETNGRFHSAWLSMMYPRLFLARQLLREDGVIFVSIDDHEVHNLRLLMNEIFGEENFVAVFVRRRRMATGMRTEPVSPDHEYVVTFAKSAEALRLFGSLREEADYPFSDEKGKYASTDLTVGMTREMRPNQYYSIRNPRSGREYPASEKRVWRFQPSTMIGHIADDNIIWPDEHPEQNLTRPRFKTRFDPKELDKKTKPVSTWIEVRRQNGSDDDQELTQLVAGLNQEATREIQEIFGMQVIDYPKPVSFLRALIALSTRDDDLVLDFFAGSCTTAHALLEQNQEDGMNRRYIMIQLPERLDDPKVLDDGAVLNTICDIGKERLRRVISQANNGQNSQLMLASSVAAPDHGMRIFTLAESTMRQWESMPSDTAPEEYSRQLALFHDPLLPGWQPEDVIWEVALKEGLSLSSALAPVREVAEATVWRVTDQDKGQSILVCLDDHVTVEALRPLQLTQDDVLVCRDVALDDTTAANLALQCRLKTI